MKSRVLCIELQASDVLSSPAMRSREMGRRWERYFRHVQIAHVEFPRMLREVARGWFASWERFHPRKSVCRHLFCQVSVSPRSVTEFVWLTYRLTPDSMSILRFRRFLLKAQAHGGARFLDLRSARQRCAVPKICSQSPGHREHLSWLPGRDMERGCTSHVDAAYGGGSGVESQVQSVAASANTRQAQCRHKAGNVPLVRRVLDAGLCEIRD
jgi:hypothetical protein